MKKNLSMVFAFALAVCLVSCGGGSSDEEKAPAISGENLQTATTLTSIVDQAANAALADAGYSVSKRSDGSLMVKRNTEKIMADSGDVNYSLEDGTMTISGTWSGDVAELKITFKGYTSSGITLTGDVTYYISGSETSFTYEYNANLKVTIGGTEHTFVYSLTLIETETGIAMSGTYNIDGAKFSYEYKYPE